jgi:ribosome maturation factor RimP
MVPFFVREGILTMRNDLVRLLEPAVAALHFELVDVEFARAGRGGVLRVFIDRDARDGAAVTVDDCARVSGAVSEVLDRADPIPGRYSLEVSSPGADRVLRTPAHFERFVGERVFVELKLPLDGRRRFVGVLRRVGGESIGLDVDGREFVLPFDRIQKARLRPA